MKISDMKPGQSGVVEQYSVCDPGYRKKLLTMGLTKGTTVKLVKVAPLGDPVELEVRGYKLSLRKDEADILQMGAAE